MTIKSGRCALVCRVFWAWHSAKCLNFAECFGLDTRQSLETLPSVFPSCTRQKRHHRAITLTFFYRVFIDTRQKSLPSARWLTLGKELFAVKIYTVCSLPSVFRAWHSVNLLYVSRSEPGKLVCSVQHLCCIYWLHSAPAIDHGKEPKNKVPETAYCTHCHSNPSSSLWYQVWRQQYGRSMYRFFLLLKEK